MNSRIALVYQPYDPINTFNNMHKMETDVKWPWNFSNHSIMNHWFNVWFKNEIFSLIQTFEKRNYVRNFFRESKTVTILFIKKKKGKYIGENLKDQSGKKIVNLSKWTLNIKREHFQIHTIRAAGWKKEIKLRRWTRHDRQHQATQSNSTNWCYSPRTDSRRPVETLQLVRNQKTIMQRV